MHLTVASWDDRVFSIDIDGNETVDTLKAILEAEANLPAAQQQLLFNAKPLSAGQVLSQAGVADGDMIMLLPAQPAGAAPPGRGAGGRQQQSRQQQQQQQAENPYMALNEDGSAKAPAAFIQQVKGNPQMMQAVQDGNPSLAKAIRDDDVNGLQVRAAKQKTLGNC